MGYGKILRDACDCVYIIAHQEDTALLETFLSTAGFRVEVVRGPYTDEQGKYSRQVKCLVNHQNAWRVISEKKTYAEIAIVIEADFVPVERFAELPLVFPFRASAETEAKYFGWLYSAGSILYGFDQDGYPHGHGNTTVAYMLTQNAASDLLDFFNREMKLPDPGAYRMWETYLGVFLRKERGILNYIPVHQYGEHGGIVNAEHNIAGIRSWHQADILWDKLAFLPTYAEGSQAKFRLIRLRAWLRGVYRLFRWRFFNPYDMNDDSSRSKVFMALFSICRMLRLGHLLVRA